MNLGQKQRRKQLETMSFFYRNINRVQYHLDSIDSIERPLPRREIDLGYMKLEVFALPGFEKERGRYLLSQTSAAIAIAQDEISARRYFSAINPLTFKVEGSKRPIRGIPVEMAFDYWISQVQQGNKKALALVHAFLQTGTEHHVDLQFDIDRKEEERVRLVELINNALSEQ